MIISEEDYLLHYGILRKSGRYPWGSGGPETASNQGFIDMVANLRKQGMSEVEIARGLGISTKQLRAASSIAKAEQKQADISRAQRLKEKGYSTVKIAKIMGKPEPTVRTLLRPGEDRKYSVLEATTSMLKDEVAKKKFIDIGAGVETHLGMSKEKLGNAVARLKEEGYQVHYVKTPQLGVGNQTTVKVLMGPDTTYTELRNNPDKIQQIMFKSDDHGAHFDEAQPPMSVSSRRVAVRYAEEGGKDADGVIYVRPGVDDLSLGGARYAQVRIKVDDTHYLKGMAIYRDDLPQGVDLMFNTNKSSTGNKLDAMKKVSDDPENPFGAVTDQVYRKNPDGSDYRDAHGKRVVKSVMNIVNEQGDWDKWSRNLSSQMLSKQPTALAKTQLDETYDRKKREFDEIMSLTNPTVKKRLLQAFADDVDSSAVHLKAAAMPRQATKVILPVNSMKENEVYAPSFRDGETVVLVRFPHGGIFEIPQLKVNNRHPEARKLIGPDAPDAIGIHSKVAERLSGADFDGDTVLVIPNPQGRIRTKPPLEGLKGFDPQAAYPAYEGMPRMSARTKGIEMGKISNLITDMTVRGATDPEIERAVRHSMVVIDAEKHNLNYKQSYINNGIAALTKKYQKKNGGASTVISNSGKATDRVYERREKIDRATGKKVYEETGATYTKTTVNKRTGEITTKEVRKTQEVSRLGNATDAHTLSSGMPIERIYANHSNRLKDLANQSRKEMFATGTIPWDRSVKEKYAREIESLDADLNIALRNSPLERQAQLLANAEVRQKIAATPDMEKSQIKKLESRALTKARLRMGAGKTRIVITDRQWEAIQAGAISPSKLSKILENADLDRVKELATPREVTGVSKAAQARALRLIRRGYTSAEVADAIGVSVSTLNRVLSE